MQKLVEVAASAILTNCVAGCVRQVGAFTLTKWPHGVASSFFGIVRRVNARSNKNHGGVVVDSSSLSC